ncbi:hypothetical protein N326_11447, partial [Eurypyga helias]
PDSTIGTEPAEEVGVVTTDADIAVVVSTTVEVDVVITGKVTVGVVTAVPGNNMVAAGATIPVAIVFTVAVVDEGVVEVLIPGAAGAAVTVLAGQQAGSLAFVGLGVVTVDAATVVLSTVTGEVVVAVMTPGTT